MAQGFTSSCKERLVLTKAAEVLRRRDLVFQDEKMEASYRQHTVAWFRFRLLALLSSLFNVVFWAVDVFDQTASEADFTIRVIVFPVTMALLVAVSYLPIARDPLIWECVTVLAALVTMGTCLLYNIIDDDQRIHRPFILIAILWLSGGYLEIRFIPQLSLGVLLTVSSYWVEHFSTHVLHRPPAEIDTLVVASAVLSLMPGCYLLERNRRMAFYYMAAAFGAGASGNYANLLNAMSKKSMQTTTLRFMDPRDERDYQSTAYKPKFMKLYIAFVFIQYVGLGWNDLIVKEYSTQLLILRYGVVTPLILTSIILQWCWEGFPRHWQTLTGGWATVWGMAEGMASNFLFPSDFKMRSIYVAVFLRMYITLGTSLRIGFPRTFLVVTLWTLAFGASFKFGSVPTDAPTSEYLSNMVYYTSSLLVSRKVDRAGRLQFVAMNLYKESEALGDDNPLMQTNPLVTAMHANDSGESPEVLETSDVEAPKDEVVVDQVNLNGLKVFIEFCRAEQPKDIEVRKGRKKVSLLLPSPRLKERRGRQDEAVASGDMCSADAVASGDMCSADADGDTTARKRNSSVRGSLLEFAHMLNGVDTTIQEDRGVVEVNGVDTTIQEDRGVVEVNSVDTTIQEDRDVVEVNGVDTTIQEDRDVVEVNSVDTTIQEDRDVVEVNSVDTTIQEDRDVVEVNSVDTTIQEDRDVVEVDTTVSRASVAEGAHAQRPSSDAIEMNEL